MPAELATTLTVTEADRLLQAEALVRSYCGWHIAPSRDETVAFNADRYGTSLLLPSLYVTAVASVTEDSTELVVTDDYSWTTNGVLTRYSWAVAPIVVEFSHGYDEPPAEVTAIVQAVAQRAVSNPDGFTSKAIGPFSGSYAQTAVSGTAVALLDAEKAVLDRYKIPPRP